MKWLSVISSFVFTTFGAFAAPVGEKQQPAARKGISHGTGPQNNWVMVIIWATVVNVVLTLFFSVKFLVQPGKISHSYLNILS